ncbi:MAG: CinA family protein [Rhizobiales bacterium]|nr:CinA family protein [Hyphomicrobiales bacterium]
MIDESLLVLATDVLEKCRARGIMVAAAESCTGGLVCAALTAIAGSSDVVDRGFVTYSNDAKHDMLGVSRDILKQLGAVSPECAVAMAEGALSRSKARIACSITGIAGPGGGSPDKPVGLVYVACAARDRPTQHQRLLLTGRDRAQVRLESAKAALRMIVDQIDLFPATGAGDPA